MAHVRRTDVGSSKLDRKLTQDIVLNNLVWLLDREMDIKESFALPEVTETKTPYEKTSSWTRCTMLSSPSSTSSVTTSSSSIITTSTFSSIINTTSSTFTYSSTTSNEPSVNDTCESILPQSSTVTTSSSIITTSTFSSIINRTSSTFTYSSTTSTFTYSSTTSNEPPVNDTCESVLPESSTTNNCIIKLDFNLLIANLSSSVQTYDNKVITITSALISNL
jgi:hypothetical protein